MADLVVALAALVVPLVMAYLLTGWCDKPRPKAESGRQIPDTRRTQE
ncbi:MAG: hypothetical protein WC091_21025 [Sulfuricellaceae bacterium]